MPNKVRKISDLAFWGCIKLKYLTISNNVKKIEDGTFFNIDSLQKVTIPASVRTIGDGVSGAFTSCESLTYISVNDKSPNYTSVDGVLFNKDKTILIKYPEARIESSYVIPDGVKKIDVEAFYSSRYLENIAIPSSVTTIKSYAFAFCHEMPSVTVPDSVRKISDRAFGRDIPHFKDWLTMYCKKNSAAHKYALKHSYEVRLRLTM
jgi:hypothetical protein